MKLVTAVHGNTAEASIPVSREKYVKKEPSGDVDAAADAVQDAFVQLCLHWDRVSEYDDPAAWVRRVAVNRWRPVCGASPIARWWQSRRTMSTV